MDLLARFQASNKPRPAEARQIPGLAVNYVDQNNEFSEGFNTFPVTKETKLTQKSLNYFDEERSQIEVPDSFTKTEDDISLDRYSQAEPYYVPGTPGQYGNP